MVNDCYNSFKTNQANRLSKSIHTSIKNGGIN